MYPWGTLIHETWKLTFRSAEVRPTLWIKDGDQVGNTCHDLKQREHSNELKISLTILEQVKERIYRSCTILQFHIRTQIFILERNNHGGIIIRYIAQVVVG